MKEKRDQKQILLYNIFKNKYQNNEYITYQEMENYSKLAESSLKKYYSSKFKDLHLKKINESKNEFEVINFQDVCETDFLNLLVQSVDKIDYKPEEYKYKKLKERSYQQFLLALEIYNKPELKNKIESFSILIANAWELLLKSKYIKNNQNIFFKENNGELKTYSLINMVKEEFDNKINKSIKNNLKILIEIRDKSTHYIIDIEEIRFSISRIFQSTVINYFNYYEKYFGNIPLKENYKGMLSIVIDGSEELINEGFYIKEDYLEKEYTDLKKFIKEIKDIEQESDEKFMVGFDYKLKINNREKNTEIELSNKTGMEREKAIIIEKTKDFRSIYPYSYSELLEELQKYIKDNETYFNREYFTKYHLNLLNKKYKKQTKYCSMNDKSFKDINSKQYFYSEEYLENIKNILNNEDYLLKNGINKKEK